MCIFEPRRLSACRFVVILLSLWLLCCVNHECRSLLLDVRFLIVVFVYDRHLYVGCVVITMLIDCVRA